MPFMSFSTRVGKYELGKIIGQGAFGKVRIARNMESGVTVAIKVMDKDMILKGGHIDKVKREIASMKLVNHPYVVKLHEVMASATKIYLVLEYVSGGTLFDKIKAKKQLKEDEARKYFQQLIDGVEYCHSHNVFHRDLKPENLLIDTNGNLKIADFGISALCQQWGSDMLFHTRCGTPSYVSPELISGTGYNGATADMWSCGIILFVSMAGYLPFKGGNTVAIFKNIMRGEFTCPSCISLGASKMIHRMLDPNSTTRITAPRIRTDEWFLKGYTPPQFNKDGGMNVKYSDAMICKASEQIPTKTKATSIDANEINSLCLGLDQSGLFEKTNKSPSVEKVDCRRTELAKETMVKVDSNLLTHWILV